jgi:hypothetical protein
MPTHTRTKADELSEEIFFLKEKNAAELELLKEQFHKTFESVKPINILKNTINDIVTFPSLKKNIAGNLLGLLTGFVSKKILVGSSHNPIKSILGTILEFAVANVVAKNADTIKKVTTRTLDSFLNNGLETNTTQNEEFEEAEEIELDEPTFKKSA